MSARHLVIMLKEPRVGRVKTRLARDIGAVAATWWFRHQTGRLIRRLDDRRWRLWLGVSPDAALASRAWPTHLPRIAQGSGDLGRRMTRLFQRLPSGPALIVGGDIPGITRTHVNRAFRALGGHDAVFGPTVDGGYWLVGLKRMAPTPPALFTDVRWSTEHALSDTLAGLSGLRIAFVETLQDVDTVADLSA